MPLSSVSNEPIAFMLAANNRDGTNDDSSAFFYLNESFFIFKIGKKFKEKVISFFSLTAFFQSVIEHYYTYNPLDSIIRFHVIRG